MTDTTSLTVVAQQVHLTVPLDIAWVLALVGLFGVMQIAFTLLDWKDSLTATLTATFTRWFPHD
jgi:hypothetical protein